MGRGRSGFAISVAFLLVAFTIELFAYSASKTYIGTIGDYMCGPEHVMQGVADCTRICVQHGSKYALILKDKTYALETKDNAMLSELNDLAGQKVVVKGTLKGTTLELTSVSHAQ